MRSSFFIVCLVISTQTFSQKVFNVIDWKPENSLNTFLLQKMHTQYDQRKIHFAKAITTQKNTLQYVKEMHQRFRQLIGVLPPAVSLNPQVTGVIQQKGYRIEKIIYESFAHHHVTASLYIPEGKGPFPAALLFCGHEDVSKATVSYQQTAILFARNGFVVFVIDPISQGERYQLTDALGKGLTRGGTTEHTLLNATANLVGSSAPAYELWDNIRGLDYLVTRKEVDSTKIGCLGNSGGGMQTIYFSAYDKRIKVIAVCSYLADRERTLEMLGPADGCAQIPAEGSTQLEMSDLLIAAAPRPVLVLAGRYDFIDYRGTQLAYKDLQQVYTSLGQSQKLSLFTMDDGHGISKPKREAAVSWFRKWLYGDPVKIIESEQATLSDKELLSTTTGQVNTAFTGEITVADRNRGLYDSLEKRRNLFLLAGKDKIREAITGLLQINNRDHAIEKEETGIVTRNGITYHKIILRKNGEIPLPLLVAFPRGNSKQLVLWLPDNGKNKLADSVSLIKTYLNEDYTVILADLRGTGETEDRPEQNDPKYYNKEYRNAMLALHIGLPLPGQRVTDILTVFDFIGSETKMQNLAVDVYAAGINSLPAIYASLYVPAINKLYLYHGIRSFKQLLDDPAAKNAYSYVIPGVLEYYDVPDLVKLTGTGRIQYMEE